MLISALKRTHDHRANIRLDDRRMACDTLLSHSLMPFTVQRFGFDGEEWVCLHADELDGRMNGDRSRGDGMVRRVVVCLTRRESDRDRYGYTHPSPTVNLHTGKGSQIPRFSSPSPNGELVLASTFTIRSTQIVPPLSGISRENARMSKIIIYEEEEKRRSEIPI